MSVSVEAYRDRRPADSSDRVSTMNDVWNTQSDSAVSPRHNVNHVVSNSSSVDGRCRVKAATDVTVASSRDGVEVNTTTTTRRLTSFSVVDILGPRYGTSPWSHYHHHHQQQQQQQNGDDYNDDDAESTSTSSVNLSHDSSSTDAPSTTDSDRVRCWAETTERRLSTSRKLSLYVML